VLDRAALHHVDEIVYAADCTYQDARHNKQGLWPWEERAWQEHFASCRCVLVTSAGGGREVLALRRRGLAVDGFECHPCLLASANRLLAQEGFEADLRLAPRDESVTGDRRYDGIIVGWGSYSLIKGHDQRVSLLKSLRKQTEQGCPLLLSFFVRTQNQRRFRVVAGLANRLRWVMRKPPVEEGDVLDPNFQHYFTEAEIATELGEAGFELRVFRTEEYGHAVAVAR